LTLRAFANLIVRAFFVGNPKNVPSSIKICAHAKQGQKASV